MVLCEPENVSNQSQSKSEHDSILMFFQVQQASWFIYFTAQNTPTHRLLSWSLALVLWLIQVLILCWPSLKHFTHPGKLPKLRYTYMGFKGFELSRAKIWLGFITKILCFISLLSVLQNRPLLGLYLLVQ